MTFIATVSMGDCTILAADRATFYVGAGISIPSAHLERKIAGNRHGYITAAGFVELIRPVKERFVAEAPGSLEAVMRLIADEQERFRRRNYLKAVVESRVKSCSWTLTLADGEKSVLAAVYDYAGDGLLALAKGHSIFNYPSDVAEHEKRHVESMAAEFSFGCRGEGASLQDIRHNMSQILSIAGYLRGRGRCLTSQIDFAVHAVGWRREVDSGQFLEKGLSLR
ncbi:hypothetical protein [Azotobacter salinestris]|uniref:hypothetical protein n=1 Tax=Azotobacter salinestris TaxID=69964 RepID=UPI001FCB85D5|nr:hypothetical protein [Azotobacter salinestris]